MGTKQEDAGIFVCTGDGGALDQLTDPRKGKSTMATNKKQACPACGSIEYDGDLKPCAYCDGSKCSMCDAGDDCACLACEEHDMGN